MSTEAYAEGFVAKCAERGIDPEALCKQAGRGDMLALLAKRLGAFARKEPLAATGLYNFQHFSKAVNPRRLAGPRVPGGLPLSIAGAGPLPVGAPTATKDLRNAVMGTPHRYAPDQVDAVTFMRSVHGARDILRRMQAKQQGKGMLSRIFG